MPEWSDLERMRRTTTEGGKVVAEWEEGRCFICTTLFKYDPKKCPHTEVLNPHTREPLCAECVAMVNERRRAVGAEQVVVPLGAYNYVEHVQGQGLKEWLHGPGRTT